jgi:hypothetical protein
LFTKRPNAIILILIVLLASVLGYYFFANATAVHYILNSPTASAETTNSTLGLQLSLSLNATMIASGQPIGYTASVFNVLPNENNISDDSNWPIPTSELRSNYSCATWPEVQVFRGYYVLANISSAGTPLQLVNPSSGLPPECPRYNYAFYLFHPLSSTVVVYATPKVASSYEYGYSMGMAGFYDKQFLRFEHGHYTVTTDDEWGQIVVLHFNVVPST